MRLLIQFPTYKRPAKFLACFEKYVQKASGKHDIFFNINCDVDDETMYSLQLIEYVKDIVDEHDKIKFIVNFDKNTEKISAINAHIDSTKFDILVCASDDMIPVLDGWDDEIARAMQKFFPNLDGALHFDDSYTADRLITLSIMGVELYKNFGYVYHPDYKSLYCDDEFTREVKRMGKYAYVGECIIRHEHYAENNNSNTGDLDDTAKKTLRFAGRDERIFQQRLSLGFPKARITQD